MFSHRVADSMVFNRFNNETWSCAKLKSEIAHRSSSSKFLLKTVFSRILPISSQVTVTKQMLIPQWWKKYSNLFVCHCHNNLETDLTTVVTSCVSMKSINSSSREIRILAHLIVLKSHLVLVLSSDPSPPPPPHTPTHTHPPPTPLPHPPPPDTPTHTHTHSADLIIGWFHT